MTPIRAALAATVVAFIGAAPVAAQVYASRPITIIPSATSGRAIGS
jgi:hypothetical protein